MEYTLNRIVRPPGMTNDCLLVEGTIELAGYDADLNIVFPGGQKAVLQWRVDGPTLDLCFDQPVDVFNDGPDMKPAWAGIGRPNHHTGVVQLVIPLRPEYGGVAAHDYDTEGASSRCCICGKGPLAHSSCPNETSGMGQRTEDGGCQHCENETVAELPYSVGLANVSGSLINRFATEQEASAFIDTLINHRDGRYYLDGPADDDYRIRGESPASITEQS